MPILTEHQEQVLLVRWFKLQHPALAFCLLAIPNGAHLAGTPLQRAKKVQRSKAEGMLVGAPDLFLMVTRGGHAGLWIEMKRQKFVPSDVSKEQREFQVRAIEQGYQSVICGGFEQAKEAISLYLEQ